MSTTAASPVDAAVDAASGLFESFSLTEQVQRHPVPSLGLAVAAGFVLGRVLGGSGHDTPGYYAPNDPFWEASTSSKPATTASDQPKMSFAGPADDGPGIITTLQSGLSDSIRKGTGQAPNDLVTTITAALTGIFVEKAKELLDQNLPGFAERYEQAAREAGTWTPSGTSQASTSPSNGGVYPAPAPAASSLHS